MVRGDCGLAADKTALKRSFAVICRSPIIGHERSGPLKWW